ncbi:MAG: NADH-quinone oxidoreductase subunit H [Gemmatimonadetes bacterium]|nr:NADH-quinone oxidoreductase subunit H [Gemmatimonadota bacterium]
MTPEFKGFMLLSVLKMLVVFGVVLVSVALLTLLERKLSAWIQNRIGPNRAGPGGLLQPAADGLKNILKEEVMPAKANPILFTMAPAMAFIPAMLLSGVIPFAAPWAITFDFTLPLLGRFVHQGLMPMIVADLPVGFLFVLAISSLGVYGIVIAGWSSNNKYSMLGGLRASAQMVSYELAMGLALIPVLLMSGNVSFTSIIAEQQTGMWYVLPLFLSFFVFLVSGFAETNRLPFDMPEAESELVAGYHAEYSAMKFSMFFIAEYAGMITIAAMTVTLFFGGWDIPLTAWDDAGGSFIVVAATGVAFVLKTFFFLVLFMWVRWTLPRFRYDQVMALGWKFMIELATVYIVVMALAIHVVERVLGLTNPWMIGASYTALNVVLAYLVFVVLDRGLIISGSVPRRPAAGVVEEG